MTSPALSMCPQRPQEVTGILTSQALALLLKRISFRLLPFFAVVSAAAFGHTHPSDGLHTYKRMSGLSGSASAYNSFVSAAVDITHASTTSNGVLTLIRSARDIDSDQRRKFLHQILLNGNSPVRPPPFVSELPPNTLARIPSPSGKKIAIFKKSNSPDSIDSKESAILEVWTDEGHLTQRISLPKTLHGDICIDTSWFGSFQWNKEEDHILYSAEMNPPTTKSYFDDAEEKSEALVGKTNTLGFGIGESWGEKYTTTCRLNIFIVNVETGNVGLVENAPGVSDAKSGTFGGYNLGQAVFSPTGEHIVYSAWDAGEGGNMPRRLGSVYCYQRQCSIYSSPITNLLKKLSGKASEQIDSGHTCLTPLDRLARSPRFVPSGNDEKDALVFLCSAKGFDTHGGCMALHRLDWSRDSGGAEMDTRKELVGEVQLPADDHSFPGLFLNQLPNGPFSSADGKYLFLTTQWRSCTKIVRISMGPTVEVKPVTFTMDSSATSAPESLPSQSLLCMTESGDAIVSQAEPNMPPVIGILPSSALLADGSDDAHIPAMLISQPGPISATSTFSPQNVFGRDGEHPCFNYHVIRTKPPHGNVDVPVEGILLLPLHEENERVPLVVVPHGGPHACTPTSYIPSYAYLCAHGKFGVLHVNFRGSSGFGQGAIESLPGNIGDLDVKDVVHLTEHVLDKFKVLDDSRVGICGGSHGGFLAGHLIGQFSDVFKVAALRNPVTNIPTMTTATDIPDWCYVEGLGLGSYDWETFRTPTNDELSKMWDASPIAHIGAVKAPTLVAVGNSDRRVPSSQGIEFYHALRSKGVDTKLLIYENDDHAIDRPKSEADHWINIKEWFENKL